MESYVAIPDAEFRELEKEQTHEYIACLNRAYRDTGDIHKLDGSTQQLTEDMAHSVWLLLRHLSIGTLFDVGCGTGSLMKRVVERLPHLTPFGVDANPMALDILRTEVLPEFASNFHLLNWDEEELRIDTDAVILMAGTVSARHMTITSRYLLIRHTLLVDQPKAMAFRARKTRDLNHYLRLNHRMCHLATKVVASRGSRTRHAYSLYECDRLG